MLVSLLLLFFKAMMVVGGMMIFVCGLSYVFAVLFGEGERV